MEELNGKVGIVSGAGRLRGIGLATAVALAHLGADVVVAGTGRDPSTVPPDEKTVGWRDVESAARQVLVPRGTSRSTVAISKMSPS